MPHEASCLVLDGWRCQTPASGPFAQVGVQVTECPHSVALGINRFGHLADVFGELGVTGQIVHKLCIGRAKQALNDRSVTRFGPRSGRFRAGVVRKPRLEIHAAEVWTSIHHQGLGKPSIAPDATAAEPSYTIGNWEGQTRGT